jgi:hypothetical protein
LKKANKIRQAIGTQQRSKKRLVERIVVDPNSEMVT